MLASAAVPSSSLSSLSQALATMHNRNNPFGINPATNSSVHQPSLQQQQQQQDQHEQMKRMRMSPSVDTMPVRVPFPDRTPGMALPRPMMPPSAAAAAAAPGPNPSFIYQQQQPQQFMVPSLPPAANQAAASQQMYFNFLQQQQQQQQAQQQSHPQQPQQQVSGPMYFGNLSREVVPQTHAALAAYFAQATKFTPPPLASHGLQVQTRMGEAPTQFTPLESPVPTMAHLRQVIPSSQAALGIPTSAFTSASPAGIASSLPLISPKGVMKAATGPGNEFSASSSSLESRKKQKKRENEVTRRTNLNDLVTVVEQAVLNDMNRMDRFADKVTVLECTARMLHEKYGLPDPSELDYDSDASSSNNEEATQDLLSQPGLDRNTKKTLRERQRRRAMNRHLSALRKMLKVDESKDKKAVLNAVIDFLGEQRKKRGEEAGSANASAEPQRAPAT